MSVLLPSHVWAQNSSSNEYGSIETDQETYFLQSGTTTLVKISGIGIQPANNQIKEKVFLNIKFPDLTVSSCCQVFSKTNGEFVAFLPLDSDSPVGTYEISATFTKKFLDNIYFQVEKAPSGYTDSPDSHKRLSSITATINPDRYEKGDSIHISGHADKVSVVTLQIIDPKYNMIHIGQTMPNSDGTYSFILKTNVQQWKHEGEFIARISSSGAEIEEFFYVFNPVQDNPLAQSTTTLTNLTLEIDVITGSGIERNVHVSGYLTSWDGTSKPLHRESIDIVNSDSNAKSIHHPKILTDQDGYFSTILSVSAGKPYQIHAVYHGSSEYEVSTSGKHRITIPSISSPNVVGDVISDASAPSAQTASAPAFDPNGVIGAIVVGIIIIGIIVAIAKRKKKTAKPRASYKPKRQPPKPTPPPPPPAVVEGPKKTHRFVCPNCFAPLKRDFVKQTCTYCGWHS